MEATRPKTRWHRIPSPLSSIRTVRLFLPAKNFRLEPSTASSCQLSVSSFAHWLLSA